MQHKVLSHIFRNVPKAKPGCGYFTKSNIKVVLTSHGFLICLSACNTKCFVVITRFKHTAGQIIFSKTQELLLVKKPDWIYRISRCCVPPPLTSALLRISVMFSFCRASLVAKMVKRLPTMRETRVQSLGREDPLEKETAPHSSTLAWKIPWTEEPDRLQSAKSAAKLLQSCPTLCDPIDGSPPGSPVPGFSRQEHWSGLPFPSPMHESEK